MEAIATVVGKCSRWPHIPIQSVQRRRKTGTFYKVLVPTIVTLQKVYSEVQ